MAGRETIGVAYVRILADGRGLGKSVEDEMKKAEPAANRGGESMADEFGKGFEDRIKRNKKIEGSLDKQLKAAEPNIRADAEFLGDTFGESFSEHWGKRFEESIKRIFPDLEHRAGDLGRRMGDSLAHDFALAGDDLDLEFVQRLRDAMHGVERDARRASRAVGSISSRNNESALIRTADRFSRIGDMVGRFTGKGARNNFVNFIGIVISGLTRIPGVILKVIDGAIQAGKAVGGFLTNMFRLSEPAEKALEGVAQAGEKAGEKIAETAAEASAALPEVAIAIAAALAVAAPAIFLVVEGAVSAMVSLVGVAAALIISLGAAVIGALAPLVGLLVPLAASIGVLALAFFGLNKQAKKALAEGIKPLKDEFNKLRAAAQQGLFGKNFERVNRLAKELQPVLKAITPLVEDIADAVGDVIERWAVLANSPGFKRFIKILDKDLPPMIRLLGSITANFAATFGNVFIALEPTIMRMLGWLDQLSTKMRQVTGSAEGQTALEGFFQGAADSAAGLWRLLKAAWGVIQPLIAPGKKVGDSLIGKLASTLEDLGAWMDAHPEQIRDWFEQAGNVAVQIGGIIKALIHLIDVMDNPRSRRVAIVFFKSIEIGLRVVAFLFETLPGVVSTTIRLIRVSLATFISFFFGWAQTFLDTATAAFGWLPVIGPKLKTAQAKFREFARTVTNDIAGIPNTFTVTGKLKLEVEAVRSSMRMTEREKANALRILLERQMGGPVWPGQPFLVGERGPEVFIPSVPGVIVPNHDPAVQAITNRGGMAGTTSVRSGKTLNVGGLTVITPTRDPVAVAHETVNALVAQSYF